MDEFLFYALTGLCVGAIYAMIALGYTLVYGIIKLINFAHGEFYMVGAYAGVLTYWLVNGYSGDASASFTDRLPVWLSIPLVLLVAGLAGSAIAVVAERVAYRPIRRSTRLVALLTAIGVSLLLQSAFTFVRNGDQLSIGPGSGIDAITQLSLGDALFGPPEEGEERAQALGIRAIQFAYIPITAVLMVLFWYVVMRTRFGKAMRATSQDQDAARLMGIDVDRVILLTFACGGFFAGVAGVLMGAQKNVHPQMGFMQGLIAFIAAVVGGIGSIPGAVLGGFLIGILQQMVVYFGVPTGYKDVAVFVVLILFLVVRPQGLLGRPETVKV